jgi:hypothetical protein
MMNYGVKRTKMAPCKKETDVEEDFFNLFSQNLKNTE